MQLQGPRLAVAALALAACSPALDWREARPDGSGVTMLLPCKANLQQRHIALAGAGVTLTLAACSAGGATWALAYADVGDPGRVGAALDELRRSAAANIAAMSSNLAPAEVRGSTPNVGSVRFSLAGHLPDGTAVDEQVVLFARGTLVLQASVVGERLEPDAVESYFASLRASS